MADIKNLLKNIEENVSLAPYTTFKIGGEARYFCVAKTTEEIMQAVQAAKDTKLPYYVLGNGSNVLVSDQGFDGLVIKIQNTKINIRDGEQNDNSKFKIIECDSGVSLGKLVNESVKSNLTGLEWAVGIPGTLGGAICSNAGAFGSSISENIKSVEVLNDEKNSKEVLPAKDCHFGYRTSIFNLKDNEVLKNCIILRATFMLQEGSKEKSKVLMEYYLLKRNKNQPVGIHSAGSIFKNILIEQNKAIFEQLLKKYSEVAQFRVEGKIPAGWLIEECGLRGKQIGGAMVSEKHGNMIINNGNAKATDVIILISLIKEKIRVNFNIQVEEEIEYVGF